MLHPRQLFNLFFAKDRDFARKVFLISGFVPRELFLYKLALTHSSSVRSTEMSRMDRSRLSAQSCNERLEFLGDSILDSVIAEYLFKIYPLKDEGFLTEMRSKIVNRRSLNDICHKLQIGALIRHRQSGAINDSMYGDALEAFIGAMFLDRGFHHTRRFVLSRIVEPHISLTEVEEQVISYKNKLIEYVQRTRMGALMFEVVEEIGEGRNKTFRIQARVGQQILGTGEGKNKKSAEQRASEDALARINTPA
ncbi:MAG: ribonuclease III [Bacteroidia bacterium]|nr:ribonuclease III [Bacteroidia bacterium]